MATTTKVVKTKDESLMPTKAVSINSPQQLGEFAQTLKKFIVQQKLFTPIKGKNYVNVEGWQFAGAATGVLPIVVSVENVSTDNEIKYRAEVKLVNGKGEQVGYGVAICSNKEAQKKSFDEYAIASMAQTRAVGKAYRNMFAWLMKFAGYEPTPAEEATYETKVEPKVEKVEDDRPATDMQISTIEKLAGAKGETVKRPKTFNEASKLIEQLGGK